MSGDEPASNNPELDRVIAEYLSLSRVGKAPERQLLLDQHPELAEELKSFFASHDRSECPALDEATMPPRADVDHATLPPGRGASDDSTIAANRTGSSRAQESRANVRYFGDYELLEEIARGGMGVVYKARQVNLNRIVALKMILAGQLAGDDDVQRFHAEAEAAANLDHPGIVPIFEVGEHEGQHYFSMGYVAGESLAAMIKDGPLPPRKAAEYTKKVAEAIAFAHDRGVIHRDLKPANVLLDKEAQPKVTDFGLAKKVDADNALTATGQILGTPSYMPPEQTGDTSNGITAAADIYALGATLYALVTGRPPFQADNHLDTILQVIEQEPAPPRLINPKVDSELETICLKCLEKHPHHRYPSAAVLAQDLHRYLEGESISVKSINLVDRVVRTLQRSRQDVNLRTWGVMLYWFAAIVLLAEIGIYVHARDGPPYPTHWAIIIRSSQFFAMGAVMLVHRKEWSVSVGAAERQMLSIWLGFFLACHLVVAAAYLSATPERPLDQLRAYPYLAIVSGLTYFVMGSSYWGQCYTFGLGFFVLAVLFPWKLLWAPLGFGLWWAVCLTLIGTRLRTLVE